MATQDGSSSAAFVRAHKQQRQELEASFVRLMKELKFKHALRVAQTILELEPGNARIKEFIPLLEEKVAMDEDDGDDEEEEEEGAEGGTGQDGEASGDSSEEDSDDDEDEDGEDEDEEEEGEGAEAGTSQAAAADKIAAHPPNPTRRRWLTEAADAPPAQAEQQQQQQQQGEHHHPIDNISANVTRLALDNSNSQLSSDQRRRIRQDLQRSIIQLKAAQKAASDDPLLGA